ncbi:NUDIX hydrolase [Patescibacteria group bacterium]|nr:NUDIX hydrolase [Candidatus Falkowbacteria bacterium]MBU3905512.1 NUDIX hydrolase [Patescibacteria group bacterium]MCG2698252.1 NUDIX hydrolase [Candidatus Parcubacteria bacterium]MBU4014716.1 NUDIX hydrolase [Patescibacteria group bacterium]MBU4026619.1 NUDIX hydrolase [Patescibacteria group bacterium]
MKPKKLSFAEFKHIYTRVPRLCVEVVIQSDKGVLLTKRSIEPLNGQWHIPGGTVLKGERIEQAVKRVAEEELGVKIKIEKMIGIIEYTLENYFSQPIGIAFLSKITSNNIHTDENSQEFGFFKIIPNNTVREQRMFLSKHFGLKVERKGKGKPELYDLAKK